MTKKLVCSRCSSELSVRKSTDMFVEYVDPCNCPPEDDGDYDAFFEVVWSHYPRKEKKRAAKARWKLYMKKSRVDPSKLTYRCVENLKLRDWTGDRYTPLLETYIREEMWEDEVTSRIKTKEIW